MKYKNYKKSLIIDMKSQWVEDSLIRTVTRHYGHRNRIVVDVTEYAPQQTSKRRVLKVASEAARRVGCSSVDCITLSDEETTRNSFKINTNEPVSTKIRNTTFVFDGGE